MARIGKPLAEKIQELDVKIQKYTEKLLALKQERKELQEEQKSVDMAELIQMMKEKGMTAAQVKAMIQ